MAIKELGSLRHKWMIWSFYFLALHISLLNVSNFLLAQLIIQKLRGGKLHRMLRNIPELIKKLLAKFTMKLLKLFTCKVPKKLWWCLFIYIYIYIYINSNKERRILDSRIWIFFFFFCKITVNHFFHNRAPNPYIAKT